MFRLENEQKLAFPAHCELCFHFQPGQPFGVVAGGGRTAVQHSPASMLFNANNGEHTIESKNPLSSLDVTIEEPIRTVKLFGSKLTIAASFESLVEVAKVVSSVYFAFPGLLNVSFADPPFIERVDGTIGSVPFRWELDGWRMSFQVTTQEVQETRVCDAWDRMGVLSEPHRRRLVAGVQYFHRACRLARQGSTVGEFLAEVLLNLAKSLEVLFAPSGDGRSRDAIRDGLSKLGFNTKDIESSYLPVIALRNQIDVGHVQLGLFSMEQLQVIHSFTERVEDAFHELFDRMFQQIKLNNWDVKPYASGPLRPEALDVIERLRMN